MEKKDRYKDINNKSNKNLLLKQRGRKFFSPALASNTQATVATPLRVQ